MKKILLILTLLFSVVAGAMAQNDAMYVYRNDGVINAFLKSDIDSIRYSKIDLDSIDHPNYVVQEVWAVDSVYRIPLAVVDSVSFVTPPTVYKRGVIDMSESLIDYIIGAEGLTLKLMTSTPSELLPKQGDKLVLLDGCEAIPNGFSGKVISVNTSGSSCIEVVCEKTYVEDIFDTFYSVQTVSGYVDDSIEEGTNSANRVVYNPKDKTFRLGSLKSSISNELSQAIVPNGDLALKGGASLTVTLEPTFRIHTFLAIGDGQGLYFSSSITGNLSVSSELSIYGGLEWQHEFLNPVFSAPIPCTADLVNFYLNPGLFIRAGAVVTSTISNTKDYSFCMAYDYSSKGENMIQPMLGSHQLSSSTDVTGSIDGSLAVGTYFETGFNIASREFMKLCLRGEYGWEAKGSYVLLNSDIRNAEKETKLYERLKASKFEFGPFINASLVAGVSGSSAGATLQSSGDFWQWDLVPTFDKTRLTHSSKGRGSADAYSKMSGTCLFPVSIGYKLYDDDMTELADYNAPSNFRKGLEALTHTFTGLDAGHKYTVYPKVKLFGHDILASPKAELTTILSKVTNFEQTGSSYSPKAEYVSGGQNYKYKFDVATTVEIESTDGIYDWGYAYESSDGKVTHISLKNYSSPYTDTRYAYYRNEPSSSVRLYGYVRYSGDGEYYYDEPQDFTLEHEEELHLCPDDHHPHLIDLGLPSGTKWACCNVGATEPEGYGDYFAWGETQPKKDYSWDTYKWWNSSSSTLTKYCTVSYNGIVDNLTELELNDDAAYKNWGVNWCMPSEVQQKELLDECNWTWTTMNGMDGYLIKSKTSSASLFLPAAGQRFNDSFYSSGSQGFYWSRSLYTIFPGDAHYFAFSSKSIEGNGLLRCTGSSIRAVGNKPTPARITDFEVMNSSHKEGGFNHDGETFDYKFEVTTTVTHDDGIDMEKVEDWGYVCDEGDDNITHISMKDYTSPYTHNAVYYRNTEYSTVWLYGYTLYKGSDEYCYDEPQEYTLKYREKGNVMLCDSIITYEADGSLYYKEFLTYDANGNQTSIIDYYWQDGQLVVTNKIEYTYDANGNQTSEIHYNWRDNQLSAYYKFEYTYDADGNNVTIYFYPWRDGQWSNQYKYEYEYIFDANGNQTSYVQYSWNYGQWKPDMKYEYTYDANGNQTSYVQYSWNYSQWKPDMKYEYTYDANGNQTSETLFLWWDDQWNPYYELKYKYDYNYDKNSNLTSETHYNWRDEQWIAYSKEEYTYDANGNLASNTVYKWEDGQWRCENECTYDENGHKISETSNGVISYYFYSMHVCYKIKSATSDSLLEAIRKMLRNDEQQEHPFTKTVEPLQVGRTKVGISDANRKRSLIRYSLQHAEDLLNV